VNRLREFDDFVWPDYDGGSIGNIPATIAELLEVPFVGLPSLHKPLWAPLAGGVKRVVLLIVDALGWNLLEREREHLEGVLGQTAVFAKITSIFPSTTVAALSTLWTGTAPAQHGLIGLQLFFPEFAAAGQMISFTPVFGKHPDVLVDAGLSPANFLQTPGFAEQLADAGIPTYAFKGEEIIGSVLSQMHGRGVKKDIGIKASADMLTQIRLLLQEKPADAMYVCGYWPSIDSLSHVYGWQGESVSAELHTIFNQINHELIQKLSRAARQETVFLLVADHGQALTPSTQHIAIDEHPQLLDMLFMRPIGEPRVAYLYVKHGCQNDVIAYINTQLYHAMIAIRSEDALASGLFGPQPFAKTNAERIGDVVVITKEGYVLLASPEKDKAHHMVGRHGSMTRAEMEVPWLGFRLDR
jgi:predicted AlkP superfamily pyrophosphatase or phosphodiesterase